MDRLTLSAFNVGVQPVQIVTPTGAVLIMHMRAFKDAEVADIDALFPDPAPPIGDVGRDPVTGKVGPIPNLEDPAYLAAVQTRDRRKLRLALIRALVDVDIPGETYAEQIDAWEQTVELWATMQLIDAFNRINGFSAEAIAAAKAALSAAPFAAGSSPPSASLAGA